MPGAIQSFEYESSPGRWCFSSAPPDGRLAGIVVEYWEVEGRLSPFRERVLPNGCTEVMFNLGPPHQMITSEGRSTWDRSWFSGLHDRAIVIESREGTHLVSARLHPLGAFHLFGSGIPGRVNAVVDLEGMPRGPAPELREMLVNAGCPEQRFEYLERFLLDRLSSGATPSSLVSRAARLIEEAHGNLRVSAIHTELGVSRKQLWLRFGRELGTSPKAYAQLQRFVWTLARLRESDEVDWSRLAVAAGYSDQAHLVRDFRRVALASPTEFLRTRTPDSAALLDEVG
jgi:AraC-like DNA-binding protein